MNGLTVQQKLLKFFITSIEGKKILKTTPKSPLIYININVKYIDESN